MSETTITIDADHLAAALALITKANDRAAKQGIAERITYTASPEVITETLPSGLTVARPVVVLVLTRPLLAIGGYTFVATTTWDAEAGAVTRVVPGVEVDLSAHRDAKVCDHCETRRDRLNTFVVREDATGRTLQVGSTCLEAFLGFSPAAAISWLGSEVEATISGLGGGSSAAQRATVDGLLALGLVVIERSGWVSSAKARETDKASTASQVSRVLYPYSHQGSCSARCDHTYAASLRDLTAADYAKAEEILAYVRSDAFSGASEYVTNLKAVLGPEVTTVANGNVPLALSAIACYARHTSQQAERATATAAPGTHVGTVGERLVGLNVTLSAEPRYIDGIYGTSTLLVFKTEGGDTVKWFASGSHTYTVGERLSLTGTVKKHEVYNGLPSTVLTRCKVTTAVAA